MDVSIPYLLGLEDEKGNEVIPLKYKKIKCFSEGLGAVFINGKYGFIDKEQNAVIPPRYDQVGHFVQGVAMVMISGETGYIIREGSFIWGPSGELEFDAGLLRDYDPHRYDAERSFIPAF